MKLVLIRYHLLGTLPKSRWGEEIDEEPVRWRAKPCGWHRRASTIRYTILSLALTIGMIILTLDSAALDLISDANASETSLQSISLDINLDPNP
jgi:hypothetical protein